MCCMLLWLLHYIHIFGWMNIHKSQLCCHSIPMGFWPFPCASCEVFALTRFITWTMAFGNSASWTEWREMFHSISRETATKSSKWIWLVSRTSMISQQRNKKPVFQSSKQDRLLTKKSFKWSTKHPAKRIDQILLNWWHIAVLFVLRLKICDASDSDVSLGRH